jgi:hypothetical protein
MNAPRTITIVIHKDNHFDIVAGDGVSDQLIFDEMIAEVIRLTQFDTKPRYMRATEQRLREMERRKERERLTKETT